MRFNLLVLCLIAAFFGPANAEPPGHASSEEAVGELAAVLESSDPVRIANQLERMQTGGEGTYDDIQQEFERALQYGVVTFTELSDTRRFGSVYVNHILTVRFGRKTYLFINLTFKLAKRGWVLEQFLVTGDVDVVRPSAFTMP